MAHSTVHRSQQALPAKEKLENGKGGVQYIGSGSLNAETTKTAADSITRVLDRALQCSEPSEIVSKSQGVDASAAVELVNDFLLASKYLRPETSRTLEMLKFRYSMLMGSNRHFGTPSPIKHSRFSRQKHTDGRSGIEVEPYDRTPRQVEVESRRRNAFELQRDELNLNKGLFDVTNRATRGSHDRLSGGVSTPKLDDTTDAQKSGIMPPPLFSPRKGPTLVHLAPTDYQSMPIRGRTPNRNQYNENYRRPFDSEDVGSSSFYQSEVEDMARQAFGGATISSHGRGEFVHQYTGKDGDLDSAANDSDEEGNKKARNIWERMRVSSEGSGATGESNEARYGDESEDEAERARECKVVGAPWLA